MDHNIFVTSSRVPPGRWRQAFPHATIVAILPADVSAETLVWLHNMTPAALPKHSLQTSLRFVVLHDEPTDEAGLAALSQGASGYCNAHATPELLHTVASVVRNRGIWVGESLLNRLIGGISTRSPLAGNIQEHPSLKLLSEREREVALYVARGESNKEIARKCKLAERTVKAHLSSIFEKLGVRDRLRLAVLLSTPE